jgi:hypothetical protein
MSLMDCLVLLLWYILTPVLLLDYGYCESLPIVLSYRALALAYHAWALISLLSPYLAIVTYLVLPSPV